MKVFHDWEFLQEGGRIHQISVAMRADDGREMYHIFEEAPLELIMKNCWLRENVVPSLPIARGRKTGTASWNDLHPDAGAILPGHAVRNVIEDFLNASVEVDGDEETAELWGYFSAFDHMLLSQLFGSFEHKPAAMPMLTMDIEQERIRLNCDLPDVRTEPVPVIPVPLIGSRIGPPHHALADVREMNIWWHCLALREHNLQKGNLVR